MRIKFTPHLCRILFQISVLIFCFFPVAGSAQTIQVYGSNSGIPGVPNSYYAMIQNLFGSGVTVSNLIVNCDSITPQDPVNLTSPQMGWFVGPGQNMNLANGLLLTSGTIQNAVGPNNSPGQTGALGTPGDPNLDQIPGVQGTNDACGIEFDIIPLCDTIGIQYVFGSEEYMEFVGLFNDIFAFYISGPNPAGGAYLNTNIAQLPASVTPVSIANVNCGTNPQYYVCNEPASVNCFPANNCPLVAPVGVQYDGLTVVLDALAAVVPCQSYHIKLVVADDLDTSLDSGVFLQAGGVACVGNPPPSINVFNINNPTLPFAEEGCSSAGITFVNNGDTTLPLTLTYTVLGTATNGLDYPALSGSVTIPGGQSTTTIVVAPFADNFVEPMETLQLITTFSACGGTISDTVELFIVDQIQTNAGPDQATCSGTPIGIGLPAVPAVTYSWSPPTGLSSTVVSDPTAVQNLPPGSSVIVNQQYIQTATDALGCSDTDTVNVAFTPNPVAAINMLDTACLGQLVNAVYAGSPLVNGTYNWTFNNAIGGIPGLPSQTFQWAAVGQQSIGLQVANGLCQSAPITENIFIRPTPTSTFTTNSPVCMGQNITVNYTGNAPANASYAWNFGGGTIISGSGQGPYTIQYPQAGTYLISLSINSGGCISTTSTQSVTMFSVPSNSFSIPSNICVNAPNQVVYTGNASPQATYSWDFGDAVWISGSGLGPYTLSWTTPSSQNLHQICLTVIENGCASPTVCQVINVLPQPVASIAPVPDQCFPGNNFTFIYTGTPNVNTYSWNFGSGATPPGLNGNPTPSGIVYANPGPKDVTLYVTQNGCLSDPATVSFDVNPKPSADFAVNTPSACLGGCVTFTYTGVPVSNQQSYEWNFGPFAAPQFSTLTNPGCVQFNQSGYQVVSLIVDNFGCKDTMFQQIYVSPGLAVSAGSDESFCEGEGPVELHGFVTSGTGTPPYFYSWWCNNPLQCGIDSVNALTPQVNPSISPTTYFFQVMDAAGCTSGVDSAIVTILPKPIADAGPDRFICSDPGAFGTYLNGGLASNNQAPGPYSYSWICSAAPNCGFGFGQDTIPSPYVNPTQSAIFTLIITAGNGCTSVVNTLDTVSTTVVTVNPVPTVQAGPYAEICYGESHQMLGYASGAGPLYAYEWTPNTPVANIAQVNNPTTTVAPSFTQTYTLSATSNGCTGSDTVTIRVFTLPTTSIEPPVADVCQGSSVLLNGTADGDPNGLAYIYSWTPATGLDDPESATPLCTPTTSTMYYLAAGTANCIGFVDSILVTVKPTAIVSITEPDSLICSGDSVEIHATHTFAGTLPGGPVFYTWSPVETLSSPNTSTTWAYPTQTTTYTVTTTVGGSCPTTDQITLWVNPVVNTQATADTTVICGNGSTTLHASGGVGGANYTWSPAFGLSDSTAKDPIVSVDTATTYILTISEAGCIGRDTITINVQPNPEANYAATNLTGCSPLTVAFYEEATDELSYVWNFGDGSPVENTPTAVHTYTVGTYNPTLTVTGANGCTDIVSTGQVVVYDTSFADFSSDPPLDSAIYIPSGITFTDNSVNGINWFWDFGDGHFSTEQNPKYIYTIPGEYTVTLSVTNENGCISHISKTPFTVLDPGIFIPNVFTPNDDGFYDTWMVQYLGTEEFYVSVFDRWGVKIFEANTPPGEWKGTLKNGKPASNGVYFYSLRIGKKVYNGEITLMR
ncbi:MAG: choice-of-anchor L domain-containing protein [Bacteroidia bacterium]|nr:choice-of-anchor L domain-containing protein [Bacteroidia bacterium]